MTSTATPEPCKLHPTRYVYTTDQYYVTAYTKQSKHHAEIQKINRMLSGKDYTCHCPSCSTKYREPRNP